MTFRQRFRVAADRLDAMSPEDQRLFASMVNTVHRAPALKVLIAPVSRPHMGRVLRTRPARTARTTRGVR